MLTMRLAAVASMVCFGAAFVACSGSGGGVDVDEDTYPADVTDLRAITVTPSSVTLVWTAPGDDEMTGTAALYDLRMAKSFITQDNWDRALQLSGEPVPHAAGSIDTMVVTGLDADSTYCFALKTRNHRGAWSWVSNCVEAMCFDNFVVTFPDASLDHVVRLAIAKATGDILRSDLLPVGFLDATSRSITNLAGLEHCIHLQTLLLNTNSVSDVSPLAGCHELRNLQASFNQITDVSPLAGLTALEQLILRDNDIHEISALEGMTRLVDVHLGENAVGNIDALAGKTAMRFLMLNDNAIADTSPLAGMIHLQSLDLSSNQATSVTALAGMTELEWLSIYHNHVADISSLGSLTNLKHLNAWSNQIDDITPLAGLTNLKVLFLNDNQISDITPVAGLTQIERLLFSDNPVPDLAPVAGLTQLLELQCMRCQVADVTALQSLVNLEKLILNQNRIVDIGPLVANGGLATGDQLYLSGNPLSAQAINVHIPALTARGVTVVF